ncbi:MAG: hypothetical protein AB7O32_10845 [Vicinamibacterales bacterium]
MADRIAKVEAAPECPACPTGRGKPRNISLHCHQKKVTYHCDSCTHEWTLTVYDPGWPRAVA